DTGVSWRFLDFQNITYISSARCQLLRQWLAGGQNVCFMLRGNPRVEGARSYEAMLANLIPVLRQLVLGGHVPTRQRHEGQQKRKQEDYQPESEPDFNSIWSRIAIAYEGAPGDSAQDSDTRLRDLRLDLWNKLHTSAQDCMRFLYTIPQADLNEAGLRQIIKAVPCADGFMLQMPMSLAVDKALFCMSELLKDLLRARTTAATTAATTAPTTRQPQPKQRRPRR
ncbi:unnamed protein product, partial [Polarella glacialis]